MAMAKGIMFEKQYKVKVAIFYNHDGCLVEVSE
jgi:hypothetical protein